METLPAAMGSSNSYISVPLCTSCWCCISWSREQKAASSSDDIKFLSLMAPGEFRLETFTPPWCDVMTGCCFHETVDSSSSVLDLMLSSAVAIGAAELSCCCCCWVSRVNKLLLISEPSDFSQNMWLEVSLFDEEDRSAPSL